MVRKVQAGPCEAGLGVDYSSRSPVVIKCHRPGVLRAEIIAPFGVILCDDCYEMISQPELGGR
jgi:hypothetical protein